MGCKKLTYYQRGEAVNGFGKNLRLVKGEKGDSKKIGLNYSTFGSSLPGRQFDSPEYAYGFNGMEKDDEIKSGGDSYDFGARMYDSRLGRWMSVDPLVSKYPAESPYMGIGNSPLAFKDSDGREIVISYKTDPNTGKLQIKITLTGYVVFNMDPKNKTPLKQKKQLCSKVKYGTQRYV